MAICLQVLRKAPAKRVFLALCLTLGLGGCSVLPEATPPDRLYDIGDVAISKRLKSLPMSLLIDEPKANGTLGGNGIVIRSVDTNELSFLPGISLFDTSTHMIQTRLVQSFTLSNGFEAVFDGQAGVRSDLNLSIRLFSFEIETNSGSRSQVARVRLKIDLFDDVSRDILAYKIFEGSAEASSLAAADAAAALGKALRSVEGLVVSWVYREAQSLLRQRDEEGAKASEKQTR